LIASAENGNWVSAKILGLVDVSGFK
jgi:hypothetical protein